MANEGGNRGLSDLISTASHLMNSSQQSHSSTASYGGANEDGKGGLSGLISTASHLMNSSQQQQQQSQSSNTTSSSAAPVSHSSRPSQSEIMASAQIVKNAAKAKMQKPSSGSSQDFDMGQLAGAASTLIGAVSSYGNLDDGNYGKYAQKAQEYLHSYEGKHGKVGMTASGDPPQADDSYQATSQSYGTDHQAHASDPDTHGQGYMSASGPNYGAHSSTGYPPSKYADAPPGHRHQQHASASDESYGQGPQGSAGYSSAEYSQAPPSHGYGHQGHQQTYTSAPRPNYGQQVSTEYPDAPQSHGYGYQGHNQPYTSASGPNYRPQQPPRDEYSDPPQSYGYGYQGHNQPYGYQGQRQPSTPYPNASNEAPMGYPPPDYPASGGSYMYPRE